MPGGQAPQMAFITRLSADPEKVGEVEASPPSIGAGEREVIALALQTGYIAVIDDGRGRERARRAGITLTGTLGVVEALHLAGRARRSFSEDLDALQEAGMYLTVNLKQRVLESFRTE